ncbi:DUF6172 family protein [Pelagibaculum spongiae]|uniref:DUF6172 family protein n=1 Tax=Pelagibaculum spongiae TaxID=2080658 RepID=UPI0019D4AD4D|nr:DUF6172 family protein [Pelagibaculum spongiae]
MKKIFQLTHEKIKYPRLVESAKHDVKKYLKRERNKKLPPDADYWGFACKFGHDKEQAKEIHLKAINKCIDEVESLALESFYLEILAYPAVREPRQEHGSFEGGFTAQSEDQGAFESDVDAEDDSPAEDQN